MKHAWNQKTDPVEFEFNGFEISSATRPSINPIAYPAKKKTYSKDWKGGQGDWRKEKEYNVILNG
jgi:hypothetical protein